MDHVAALAMHSSGCPLASRASLHSGRRTLLTGAQPASHWRSYRDFKQSIAARAVEDTTAPAAETPIPVPRPPKRPAGMSPVQQYKEYGWFASQLPEGEVGRFRWAAAASSIGYGQAATSPAACMHHIMLRSPMAWGEHGSGFAARTHMVHAA